MLQPLFIKSMCAENEAWYLETWKPTMSTNAWSFRLWVKRITFSWIYISCINSWDPLKTMAHPLTITFSFKWEIHFVLTNNFELETVYHVNIKTMGACWSARPRRYRQSPQSDTNYGNGFYNKGIMLEDICTSGDTLSKTIGFHGIGHIFRDHRSRMRI